MSEVLDAIQSLREELRDDVIRLHEKMDETRKEVSDLATSGCGQSWRHAAAESRILNLEADVNKGKGMAALIGAVSGAVLGWIGSKL